MHPKDPYRTMGVHKQLPMFQAWTTLEKNIINSIMRGHVGRLSPFIIRKESETFDKRPLIKKTIKDSCNGLVAFIKVQAPFLK
jgi:hypothetical protein